MDSRDIIAIRLDQVTDSGVGSIARDPALSFDDSPILGGSAFGFPPEFCIKTLA
jgi:hypothetical protein